MHVVLKLYYYYYYVFYSNRRRVALGLVNDPSTHMNDAELARFATHITKYRTVISNRKVAVIGLPSV